MSSKRSKEGYLLLDHRAAHGIVPDAIMVRDGLPPGAGVGLFESPTFTCSHCQCVVVMNPKRTRERGYCRGCDSYLCDPCTARRAKDFTCKTFNQAADEYLNALARNSSIILP